jgi:hypothetical protein
MKMMKTQLLSVILLGSISGTSASAIKNATAESQGITPQNQPALIAQAFFRLADQSVKPSTTTQQSMVQSNSLHASSAQYAALKSKLYRMAGPSNMFRRVVSAPVTGGSLDSKDSDKPATSSKTDVTLKAKMPDGFSAKDVEWFIKSKDGDVSKKVKGSGNKVSLAKGKYNVEMKVDKYSVRKTLTVGDNSSQTFKVAMKAGKLKASASFSGGIKEKVRFNVYKIKGGQRKGKIITVNSAQQINQALPPGDYEVEVKSSSGKESSKKRVSVNPGKTTSVKLTLEANKVTLMAQTKDNQPFMGKAEWKILHASNNKTITTASRHTAQVMLPAGPYIAKMKTEDGEWKIEKFTVTPGEKKYVKVKID